MGDDKSDLADGARKLMKPEADLAQGTQHRGGRPPDVIGD